MKDLQEKERLFREKKRTTLYKIAKLDILIIKKLDFFFAS